MTLKQLFEATQIELKKVESPTTLVEDWNYFANKAYFRYINKKYNLFEANAQITDDLSRLKTSVYLDVSGTTAIANMTTGIITNHYINPTLAVTPIRDGFKVLLPNDYFHITSLVLHFYVEDQKDCYTPGTTFFQPCKRMTDDSYAATTDNPYLKPKYRRPYYIINDNPTRPTSIFEGNLLTNRVDGANNSEISILTGSHPKFTVSRVELTYIRVPRRLLLTYEEAFNDTLTGSSSDTSQVLEFPDYICYEILNDLVLLLMENNKDERRGEFNQLTQTIAPPGAVGQ